MNATKFPSKSNFKFDDYADGVGKTLMTSHTIDEAMAILKTQSPQPRLNTAELHAKASELLHAFPFADMCKRKAGALVSDSSMRSRAAS